MKIIDLNKRSYLKKHWTDVLAIILLFSIALFLRLSYQKESIINNPLRADAGEYFFVAYNLYRFNVYSTEPINHDSNKPPKTIFRRPPGYPLFLYPFIAASKNSKQFLDRVAATQALLSAFMVVIIYLIGRSYSSLTWAFIASLSTALCPHLIAMDQYLLSESLFTFTITLATLFIVLSRRYGHPALTFLAGAFLGYSSLIRPLALLLGPFMCLAYFTKSRKWAFAPKSIIIVHLIYFLVGYSLIYSPYLLFQKKTKPISSNVSKDSAWGHFLGGTDIKLKTFIRGKIDPKLRAEKQKMRQDKSYGIRILKKRFLSSPLDYMKWYLGGKVFFMWQWDNVYVGDVYQYPMIRKGFQTNLILKIVHTIMHWLHWPLFLLTLSAPFILLLYLFKGRLGPEPVEILAPLLMFLYFAFILTILMPLPRYAIPARPFSYLLAAYALQQIFSARIFMIKNVKHILKTERIPSKRL